MSRIGRNDPCPCGSGKKYKKCCLPKDEAILRPPKTHHDYCLEVAQALRSKILKFMKKAGHDRHIEDAMDIYWQTLEPDLDPPELDDYWHLKFLEWFIHDYPIPEHDLPVIQLFLESQPLLPAEEMQTLQDWQDAHLSVYQIKEVEPGVGMLAEDIFTGEEFFLNDVRMSRRTRKWQLLTTRVVRVLDEWQCSSAGSLEPPTAKEEIIEFVMAGFHLIRKLEPGLELQDFLRAEGLALHQRLLTAEVTPNQPPKIFTASGEELAFFEARYDLVDLSQAVDRLESQDDFSKSGWEEDEDGQIMNISFNWLEKGRSARKSEKIRRQTGFNLGTVLTPGPGQEASRVLGNILLEPDQLLLEVQGEQRFALGKKRLETALAGLIQHRQDTVRTLEEMFDDHPPGKTTKELEADIPPEIRQAILKEHLDQHYQQWLVTPLPALNGKTPRQAIKTAKGQQRVEDLLRTMEYHHQNNMEYDVSWIRRELGL